ncbi:MAG: deoxyribodipyrimidine photo-lyase [Gemmatimonadota bacterium]|nr:deoxyribodipyrimidine photo-lyase [Gemmatimonadota bacterium]
MTTTDSLRLHAGDEPGPRTGGEFVLYWIQTTMRAWDNPALNFAIEQANLLRLPLLVYQGLRSDYPWANDRIHTFILESVVDLQSDFERRGIAYAFYLESGPRESSRVGPSPLLSLADRAALVVTDFFPTFIVPRQIRALRLKTETPVVAVDGCTLVPMKALGREFSTARAIRPRLLEALPHYLHPVPNPEPDIRRSLSLPFEPVRPAIETIAGLVARCEIDHAVKPSPGIRGGRKAALSRLKAFLRTGLTRYTEDRGDPNVDATSRLSPYLHFGNLSINEVLLRAREAGPPAQYEKFQDEAVTWRELAHNYVFHNPKHRTMAGVPAWAQKELSDHEADPRPALYSDDDLEYARTHDDLWNAAQRSLLRDGELHNYVRMLWGKSVLMWKETPSDALRVLEHLNHKYALDGRDPSSYGGIFWCFGKFDRPFYRRPVYGTVRYMSLKAATGKFDARAYINRYA